jgi:hypothetical protein
MEAGSPRRSIGWFLAISVFDGHQQPPLEIPVPIPNSFPQLKKTITIRLR